MKKVVATFFLLIVVLLISCAPSRDLSIDEETIDIIGSSEALRDWKLTLNDGNACSAPQIATDIVELFIDSPYWRLCCQQHDFDYRFGYKYGINKDQADYELWACIDAADRWYSRPVANVIYRSVWLFGSMSYHER